MNHHLRCLLKMLKEGCCCVVGGIVFQMMLPLTDSTDCPRVVCLKGTPQSPPEVALVVEPLLKFNISQWGWLLVHMLMLAMSAAVVVRFSVDKQNDSPSCQFWPSHPSCWGSLKMASAAS